MSTPFEAARILLTVASHLGMQPDDGAYLARLVAARTGLSLQDTDTRVAQIATSARDNIARARRSAVLLAFMIGAAALLDAAAVWYGSCLGAQHRVSSAGRRALRWSLEA